MSAAGDGFLVRSLASTYPDGMVLADHDHPWGQLVYGRTGVMRVTTAGRAWLAPATRAVWLPPLRPHSIRMSGAVAMRTLYIAPQVAGPLPDEACVLEVGPLLRELVLHILALGMLDPAVPEHGRLAGVLIDVIAAAPREDLALPLPIDPRALALAQQVQAAPDDRTDLPGLARAAGASLRTLQRIFPRETGLSLEAWRRKARMIHAVAALCAGSSVTGAALDCGYDSPSAFITAFRRQFGVTPGRYRPAQLS
ncbi:MAG: helix-turn-helix transcriptional regulator [Phenylobacterium sp.]|uniref:AraC family transcriptional regulator n=1 Tax=Phenylobacterium sp. TaxID=1871053 RepID=UPI001B65785B|nr:helix-turn-helix transcriptional regulator [Phenylobacterium sp.]MBP7816449.1 helix-turn-helix transcriptional regulator [Phenylobacterium sp.]MBP9754544.1 helix-turn-helix transcriptional regulator [Phenylobacterium sp.]